MTDPSFPPGRYGRRRERGSPPRWVLATLLGLVVAVSLALAVAAFRRQTPQVQSSVTSFSVGAREVRITFEVHRPQRRAAICRVRARDAHGAEVGRADIDVPAGQRTVTITTTLPTRGSAVTGEVYGCSWRKG